MGKKLKEVPLSFIANGRVYKLVEKVHYNLYLYKTENYKECFTLQQINDELEREKMR